MSKRYVGIIGSRKFSRMDLVIDYVRSLPPDTVVVSGTEPPPPHVKRNRPDGVDETAIREARQLGLKTMVLAANWNQFGPSAGMIRNSLIIKYSDEVNAFWDGVSSGTADGIEKARQKGNLGKVIIVR